MRHIIGALDNSEKLQGYQIRQRMVYEVEMEIIQTSLFFGLSGYIIQIPNLLVDSDVSVVKMLVLAVRVEKCIG